MSAAFSVSDTLGDLADAGRRGAGIGLSSRMTAETALPIEIVRQLRPHAARRGTTVPLVALEIVEAAVDLGCVADLIVDRVMPGACERPAARFALNYAVSVQLRTATPGRGTRTELLARAVVEAALDQGRVDWLLIGRFDRGDAHPPARPAAQLHLPPPPASAAAVLPPPAPQPDPIAAAFARWAEQAPEAAFAPPRWRVILAEVATAYACSIDEVTGPSRRAKLMRPRFEAAYRLWRELGWSLDEVGRRLGGRDHTTVLRAIRHHAARLRLPLERLGRTSAADRIADEAPGAEPTPELAPPALPPPESVAPVQLALAEPALQSPQDRLPNCRQPRRRPIAAILADADAGYRALRARP